jgi:hypothetical protein
MCPEYDAKSSGALLTSDNHPALTDDDHPRKHEISLFKPPLFSGYTSTP